MFAVDERGAAPGGRLRCRIGRGDEGGGDRRAAFDRACNHVSDKFTARVRHLSPQGSYGLSSICFASEPMPRIRIRYQMMMSATETAKISVETALISGVMPRRKRPQISSGRVLSRPMRKKVTAISSIESVK